MTKTTVRLTAAVETYFTDLWRMRASGGATGERSSYGPLTNLLNAVGAALKPKVFCVGELADHRPFPRPPAGGAAPVALRVPIADPPAPFLPLDIACSSSLAVSHRVAQITVQRNRGAGDDLLEPVHAVTLLLRYLVEVSIIKMYIIRLWPGADRAQASVSSNPATLIERWR